MDTSTASSNQPLLTTFKGIALFTPGGDLVYCIDPHKRDRWHSQLCSALQEVLGLMEPPNFLVPCYTATIDCWLDPHTQQRQILAEAFPSVLHYQVLLNTIFNTQGLVWQAAPVSGDLCDPMLIATYYHQFPELWQDHDLVMNVEHLHTFSATPSLQSTDIFSSQSDDVYAQGYVFRLFVSGYSQATERALQSLHQILTQSLQQPYTLKVVDIQKHPELAEENHISATPTLLRVWPKPIRRVVGELLEPAVILRALGL
ncbi:MAG: circadian clock KaiB family protein [Cyanobacteria bacterium]|nr:circadian clock KaiB family protein [Cyanobacteriota bacterium]MDW8201330.1 circadian clock KaiB family protein [Cyanobacteriota bacterium SKYGB_h_bin112]